MSEILQRSFQLSKDNLNYLDDIRLKKNCKNRSDALRIILHEHETNNKANEYKVHDYIAEKVSDNVNDNLNKIKYSTNQLNKEIEILKELINCLYYQLNLKEGIFDSEKRPHGALTKARMIVEERLALKSYKKNGRFD